MSVYSSKITPETTPKQPIEVQQEKKVSNIVSDSKTNIEPAASVYENINGMPYLAKYFDIKHWNELTKELDISNTKEKVNLINNYILEEIRDHRLEDTVSSFNDIIKNISSQIGLNDKERVESKLERLYEYIKILTKQKKLDNERRAFYGKFTNRTSATIFI